MAEYTPDRARTDATLRKSGIVVVMNADHVQTADHMVTTVLQVYAAGYVPEVTFRIAAGILREGMSELRRRRQEEFRQGRTLVLGVGSIVDSQELDEAVELGFDLLVGPGNMVSGGADPGLELAAVQRQGIAVAPAVLSPSELQYMLCNAHGFEPDAIKVFPAGVHGPKGLSDLLAPYARERHRGKIIMPTGAVNYETGPEFVRAIRSRGFVPVLGMSAPLALVSQRKEPGNSDLIAESLRGFAERFGAAFDEVA
jgi:2-keto-3-deoxy-6-phosphogluconate aldolase